MGSLTPLATPRAPHNTRKPIADSDSSFASTKVLAVLTALALLAVLLVAGVLLYVVTVGQDRFVRRTVVKTESDLRAERLADSLGAKAKVGPLLVEIVQKEEGNVRSKRSPLLTSVSSFVEGSSDPTKMFLRRYDDNFDLPRGQCRKRSLAMCAGQVPFNSTAYPNFIGDENETEANRSLPYFNYIAKSRCNRRIKQLLCSFLEPQCDAGRPIPPCKKFCRIALEGCAEYIPATLELSAAFDCRRYPDSTDPRVCVNLAMGKGCAADEFQCPDRSCIPRHWVCDGVRDCAFAADEANCQGVGE